MSHPGEGERELESFPFYEERLIDQGNSVWVKAAPGNTNNGAIHFQKHFTQK